MKKISRTIESIKINAQIVFFNEKMEIVHEKLEPVITTDSEEKVRKNQGKYFTLKDGQTLVIESIEKNEKVYEVPVDEFIKLAESLEKKEEIKEDNKSAEQVEKDLEKEA